MTTTSILNDQLFNDEPLTEEEEAVLERLEAEWLAMCRGIELESYDYYSIGKDNKTNSQSVH